MTPSESSSTKKLSIAKAIAVGQLVVNGGVFIIIGAVVLVCYIYQILPFLASLALGALLAWPWWSVTVPRWRRWALMRGVNPKQLQKAAVNSMLVWPKGWVFEKTEIPPRKRQDD